MLGDKLFKFQKRVADKEGFLINLKKEFKDLDKFIKDNKLHLSRYCRCYWWCFSCKSTKIISAVIKEALQTDF